jgi:Ca-activated chloride channel family protein
MKRQFHDMRRITLLSALVLAAFLSAAPQTPLAQQKLKGAVLAQPTAEKENDNRITISTELVSLTVAVTDKKGRHVDGLDRGAFAVYEDDVRQEISFFSDRDAPASVGVVFDVSGSMSGEKIVRARDALARFIQTSHPEDEYSLIGFSESAELLLDRTRDSEALLARFANLNPHGSTALYDAVSLGIEALADSRYAKRALIVVSDGEDNKSRATLSQVKRKSLESGVTIYTILIGPSLPRSNGGAVMDQLASASGGKSFFPGGAEAMSEAFERIALELRRQYSIGYAPANAIGDGRWRRLKVAVTPPAGSPQLAVRSRKGYYATANLAGLKNDRKRVCDEESMRFHVSDGLELAGFQRRDCARSICEHSACAGNHAPECGAKFDLCATD